MSLLTFFAATCSGDQIKVGDVCNSTGLPTVQAGGPELQQVLQIALGIMAALAVLFVVIGALRYVLSAGKPEDTGRARAMMVYAVVGLVVAISAEAFVTFVLNRAS